MHLERLVWTTTAGELIRCTIGLIQVYGEAYQHQGDCSNDLMRNLNSKTVRIKTALGLPWRRRTEYGLTMAS